MFGGQYIMIKLFKEYNKWIKAYYYEVSYASYIEVFGEKNFLSFDLMKERNILQSIIRSKGWGYYYDSHNRIIELHKGDIEKSKGIISINIVKIDDEWYYVGYEPEYDRLGIKIYKCDQFEGLLKCLQDIL